MNSNADRLLASFVGNHGAIPFFALLALEIRRTQLELMLRILRPESLVFNRRLVNALTATLSTQFAWKRNQNSANE